MFGFFDVIQDILSNLRTFGLRDVIDIAVVSLAMYQIFLFARKSRAGQLVRGLLLLLVFYALADVMQLRTVRWVLTNVMQIGFIAAIVLFQPELRRTLEHMGQSTNWTKLLFTTHRQDPTLRGAWQSAVVAICDAAEQLSDTRTGALMVLERMNNLDEIIRTGTPLSADVIPEMLGTIFYEGTPLHDGAVVIRDGRIVAAGCVLPLSNNLEMGKDMGTRHRAGLGMSENSDAIVVVVSEETGIISLAKNGVLIRRLDRQNLFNLLQEEIIPPETAEAQKQPLLNRLLNKGGAGNSFCVEKTDTSPICTPWEAIVTISCFSRLSTLLRMITGGTFSAFSLIIASRPTASVPQMPLRKCTATAPTGSSTCSLLSKNHTPKLTIRPETTPTMMAPVQSSTSQPAVMPTRPAREAFRHIDTSGLP